MNPLLQSTDFPPFSSIKAEHIEPALDAILSENRATLKSLLENTQTFTWDNLMQPLEAMDAKLHACWSPVSHLHSVADAPDLRAAYNACLPKLSEYATDISQNETLYQAIQSIKDSDAFNTLSQAQRKTIENALRDFHLSGVDLPTDKKQQYAKLQKQSSQLTTTFSQNVLDSTQAWTLLIDTEDRLSGLTQHAIDSAKEAAADKGKTGYLFTLEIPSYLAVMQYADDRTLRQTLYQAYVTRASDQGPHDAKHDNSDTLLDILKVRKSLATLLSFNHFADYSLATKMADSTEEVLSFLKNLADKSKDLAQTEMQTLEAFAKTELGLATLEPWDVAYASEKLRKQRYDISQETLRPYFPLTTVLSGLFKLLNRLYHVSISEKQGIEVYHPDVKCYEVRDQNDVLRGYFYLDPFVRTGKRGGAWMDDCQVRRKVGDTIIPPIAYVVCNFAKPLNGKPALLTHDDVITLFHEFGHCFHHLLTKIDYPDVSGINGVAWDAVELPSQFMENWCWQRNILNWISSHHETGEPLPDDLFEKLTKAKNYHSGMQMLRQLEFALFDFMLHQQFDDTYTYDHVQSLLNDIRHEVAVVPNVAYNRFQNSFSHVFAGGYAAGYYSYKWAEVLSADAFAKFEESGFLDGEAGQLFLEHILEKGGSDNMKTLYQQFRGRDATVDALLRHSGIMSIQ